MLVSAPIGLSASAATERKHFESADYADYAEKECQNAGTGRRRQEQQVGGEHRSVHLIVSIPSLL